MLFQLNIVLSLIFLLSSNIPESRGRMTTSTTTATASLSIVSVVQTFPGMSTGDTGLGVFQGRTSALSSNSSGITNELLLQSQHQQHPARVYNWPCLVLLSCIALAAFWGNVLVCLAVCCKRKLQSMFNCFLVSLALSDMMSAMLVMPLSILKTSVEPLPLPKFVCVAWYCLDVLFTSSTICHLCMISIDRYLTLTFPLRYGRTRRRKKQTIAKLAVVWVISTSIAGPLFILNMMESSHSDNELAVFKGCGPENPTFVISSTVISFYLPLLIMTVMYALTVKALQQQLKEQRRIAVTNSVASSSISGPSTARGGLMRSKSDRRPWRSLKLKNDSCPQSDRNLFLRNSNASCRSSGQTRQVFGSLSKESTDSSDSIFKRWAKKVHDFTNRKSMAPDRSTTECLPNLEELLGTSDYSALTNATRSAKHEHIDATSTGIGTQSGGESSRTDAKRRAVRMDYTRMDFSEDQKELTSPESVGPTEIITSTFKSSPVSSESICDHSIMNDSFLGAIINDDQFSETVGLIQSELESKDALKFLISPEDAEGSIGSLSDTANDQDEEIVIISPSEHQLHQTPDVGSDLTPIAALAEASKEISLDDHADYSPTKSPEQIFQSTTSDVSKATTPLMKRSFRSVNNSSKSANKISTDRSKWKCGSKLKNPNSRDLVTPIITVDLADESPPSHDGSECCNVALDLTVYTINTPTKSDPCFTANNSFETTTFISSKPSHGIETIQTEVKIPAAKQEALKEVHKFPPTKQLSLPTKRKTDTVINKNLNPDPIGICLTPSKLLSGESPNENDKGTGCTLSVPELSSLKRRNRNNSLLDINFNNQVSVPRSPAGSDRRLTTSSLSTFNTPLRHRLSAVSASFGFRPSVCSTGSAGRYGLGCPDKGRRAVQVLGILFAVFVVCYLPFFALYLVNTTCSKCREYISQRTLAALEWLGYSGSLLNPIIYHIFSPDFRLAFHDLIRCRCCRQQKRRNFQLVGNIGKDDITKCTRARNYCRKPLCFAGTCRNCLGASTGKQPTGISSRQSDLRQSTRSQTNQTQESVVITFDS